MYAEEFVKLFLFRHEKEDQQEYLRLLGDKELLRCNHKTLKFSRYLKLSYGLYTLTPYKIQLYNEIYAIIQTPALSPYRSYSIEELAPVEEINYSRYLYDFMKIEKEKDDLPLYFPCLGDGV